MIVAAVSWLRPRTAPGGDNPLEHATFSPLTNWEGAEEGAEISPDGRFVAFLSDRDGEYDIWLSQIGTGQFENLTKTLPPLAAMGFIVRKLGFTADGSQLWFNPADNRPLVQMPLATPTPRPILREGANTPAWSPSGGNIVYVYKAGGDDPVYLADGTGADPQVIVRPDGLKTMNPVWSPDGQWIYFTRGPEPLQDEMTMDVWRVRPSGESLERLSTQSMAANFLAPLDARTLLYVGRAPDLSGPWLWAFDVERRTSRRVTQGIEQYTSVSSSRDGRRVVATVTNPSAGLWQVPVRTDRPADEREVQAYTLRVPTGLARAPRFGSSALFYLSARGTRDGLWKVQDGQGIEVWSGVDGALSEPCAVSPDGTRIAVIVRREGKRRLMIMSADGTGAQTLAPALEIEGAPGQGAVDWSPDGTRIVAGGRDANGAALFVIAVDSGVATRIRDGPWGNPVWSPRDDLIIYAGRSLIGQVTLLGIRPDGTAVELPPVQARPGGYRFLPDRASSSWRASHHSTSRCSI
jgi:Tol biopolymer transport system component